jgi:hypothetical protein
MIPSSPQLTHTFSTMLTVTRLLPRKGSYHHRELFSSLLLESNKTHSLPYSNCYSNYQLNKRRLILKNIRCLVVATAALSHKYSVSGSTAFLINSSIHHRYRNLTATCSVIHFRTRSSQTCTHQVLRRIPIQRMAFMMASSSTTSSAIAAPESTEHLAPYLMVDSCSNVNWTHSTAKQMLKSKPRGAYTTMRTVNNGAAIFQLSAHITRLGMYCCIVIFACTT